MEEDVRNAVKLRGWLFKYPAESKRETKLVYFGFIAPKASAEGACI